MLVTETEKNVRHIARMRLRKHEMA